MSSFRLLPERTFPRNIHRSGWPSVLDALHRVASDDPDAPLLDDFVDAHFSYRHVKHAYKKPWVGIFHHPATVKSPLPIDAKQQVQRNLTRDRFFRASQPFLRGAICLTPQLGDYVRRWLRVPVIVLKHPTELDAATRFDAASLDDPKLWQIGFFLRDLRFLHKLPLTGTMPRARSAPNSPWTAYRDRLLQKRFAQTEQKIAATVEEVERLENDEYDGRMSESVVVTRLYGAAANNVVVECMARNCPLLVNRLPDVESYLGREYPLFFEEASDAAARVRDAGRLRATVQYLESLDKSFMDFDAFAEKVREFVSEVTR